MTDTRLAYDVAVEESGLNWEKAGPLFDRYAVTLLGPMDRRWVDCYQRISVDLPTFSRFRLEPATSSVTFTCRSTDGPADVMKVIKRLQDLLLLVNREAAVEQTARPSGSAAATATARPKDAPARSQVAERPTGLAAGLLARFTRH